MSDSVALLLLFVGLCGPAFAWGAVVARYLKGALAIVVGAIGLPIAVLAGLASAVVLSTLAVEPQTFLNDPVTFVSEALFGLIGVSAMMSSVVVPLALVSMAIGFVLKRVTQKVSIEPLSTRRPSE